MTTSNKENIDRFIPNRAAMDFDFAFYQIMGGPSSSSSSSTKVSSPSREAYRQALAQTMNFNRTRILAFKNKPPQAPAPVGSLYHTYHSVPVPKPRGRYIPKTHERMLDLPGMEDDFHTNLLDWGSTNVLAIALGHIVYLWDASNGSTSELVSVDEDDGPVTSINWAQDGHTIAVGLNNSQVQIWDSADNRKVKTFKCGHESGVGSLAWNDHILTTGGMDGKIINNDLRVRSHVVQTYKGHTLEVCGLKWSPSGQQLVSGGSDSLVHVWDRRRRTRCLHKFQEHTSAVKALDWCPFQTNLLATGACDRDGTIKFWNTITGACLNTVQSGSQVCSLLWRNNERELLSSHGFSQNQLTLWKYPSMLKLADLYGHTSRVLYTTQSPDGCTVASASADETLRFWNVFGVPELAKKAAPKKSVTVPFSHVNCIR